MTCPKGLDRNADFEQIQAFVDGMDVGVAVFDTREKKYLAVNEEYCRIKGYGKDEIESAPLFKLRDKVHPDDKDKVAREIEDFKATHRIDAYTRYFNDETGGYDWIKIHGNINDNGIGMTTLEHLSATPVMTEDAGGDFKESSFLQNIAVLPGAYGIYTGWGEEYLRLVGFSDKFCELFAGTRAQIEEHYKTTKDVIGAKDLRTAVETFRSNPGKGSFYMEGITLTGRAVPMSCRYSSMTYGGKTYVVALYTDLTAFLDGQRKLERLNDTYRIAADRTKIFLWEIDLKQKVLHRIGKIAESDLAEKVGIGRELKNPMDFLNHRTDSEGRKQLIKLIKTIKEGGTEASDTIKFTVDGQVYYMYIDLEPAYSDGNLTSLLGITQDVTDRYLINAEYDRSVMMLLKANPAVRCAFHLNLTKNEILAKEGLSEYTRQLMDASNADELLDNIRKIIVDEKASEVFARDFNRKSLIDKYNQGNQRFHMTYLRSTESGRTIWVRTHFQLLLNPGSGDCEAVAFTEDYDREHREETILNNISERDYEAIGTIDVKTHKIRYYTLKDNLITSDEDESAFYETALGELASHAATDRANKAIQDALSIDTILAHLQNESEYTCNFQIGSEYKVSAVRFLDESQQELLYRRYDVTKTVAQRKEVEDNLREALDRAREANEAKTKFISRISHDIRTPLAAITGMTEFAMEDLGDSQKTMHDLENIKSSSEFLYSLVNDILDVSKMDSDQIELRPEPYTYARYKADLVEMFTADAKRRGVNIKFITQDDDVTCLMDPVRFKQIALNVISNALKYTPKGGCVDVTLKFAPHDDTHVMTQLLVKDTGIGMSEKFMENIFEPFHQDMDNDLRRKIPGGTGLGLYIVKRLVEIMGGSVTVDSVLGEGTTIEVLIPLEKIRPEQAKPQREEHIENIKLEGRVLLAEDNEINTEIATRLIEELGLDLDTAEDGQAALDKYRASAPGTYNIVLTDIQMPRMDGYGFARALRDIAKDEEFSDEKRKEAGSIPIVAMTADAFDSARQKALDSGMDDFVTKPLNLDEVKKTIAAYINK